MIRFLLFLLIFATTSSASSAHAQQHSCSQAQIDKLEDNSGHLKTWQELHRFFTRYIRCQTEDASVQTGVSESVARLFVDHWDTLPVAWPWMRRSSAFERFVLDGINETLLVEDLNAISAHAHKSCPGNLHRLCQKIQREADFKSPA